MSPEIDGSLTYKGYGEISAIVGPNVVKLLCAGFAYQESEATVLAEFMEEDGTPVPRVVDWAYPFINSFCATMLGQPETSILCRGWYENQLREARAQCSQDAQESTCHMGVNLVSIPLAVGGLVKGMLFTGMRRQKGEEGEIYARLRSLSETGTPVAGLEEMVKEIPSATLGEFGKLSGELGHVAAHILQLVDDKFNADANVAALRNLTGIAAAFPVDCPDHKAVWEASAQALHIICDFFGMDCAGVFTGHSGEEQMACVAEYPTGVFSSRNVRLYTKQKLWKQDTSTDNEGLGVARLKDAEDLEVPGAKWVTPIAEGLGVRAVIVLGPSHFPSPARLEWVRQACSVLGKHIGRLLLQVQLRASDMQKEIFLREMAHQLKGPVQSILAESLYVMERLATHIRLDDDLRLSEERIRDETGVLKARMQTVNFFSGTTGKVRYLLRRNSIWEIIKGSVKRYSLAAKRRSVTIDVSPEVEKLPSLVCDEARLTVVFDNLLDNAIKYSHSEKTVRIYAKLTSYFCLVFIEDYGYGIKQEDLPRVFWMFERGSVGSRYRLIPGTGIGLAVSQAIMRIHGGRVEIKSIPQVEWTEEEGKNYLTTATVFLPSTLKEEDVEVDPISIYRKD